MHIDTAYLKTYYQRIVSELKKEGKADWRWEEFSAHIFNTGADASEALTGKKRMKMLQTASLIGGGVVIALIVFLILLPSVRNVFIYSRDLEKQGELYEDLLDRHDDLQTAWRNYEQIRDDIDLIDEAMPDSSDLGRTLRIIGKIADDVISDGGQMVIQTINADTIPSDNEQTALQHSLDGGNLSEHEMSFTIALSGNFQAVRDFVARVKSARHNFRIDQIVFTPTSGGSDLLDVVIFVSYYYYN